MAVRPELTGKRFFPKTAVAERYAKSTKTVDRWVQAGILPPADLKILNRNYWSESVLDERDRLHAPEQGS